jgi:pyruvate/2-oxoglutarate dehydrogenase complex dihydrolipoamide dehydrogenase (E3) component
MNGAMHYDLVVIGGGSAGLAAAISGARMGSSVALVEADRLGGDCTWTGCVPSKALVHAAAVVHAATSGGFLSGKASFAAVRAHVVRARQRVADFETSGSLRALGIDVVLGTARFTSPSAILVNGTRIEGGCFVICAGASPVVAPIPGLAGSGYLTNETVFELDELPDSLLVVGGGPIGVELAQAFSRLGSRVTLAEALPRLLSVAEPEASEALAKRFRDEEIELLLGQSLDSVEPDQGRVVATIGSRRLTVDRVLLAVGRRPHVEGLGLEGIGVAMNGGGIQVNDRLRTSVPHIFAAGDVTGGAQFTHYAVWQGFAAARNALFPGSTRGQGMSVPWAIFTDPEIAQVGLTEDQARERDGKVSVHRWPIARVDRAQTMAEPDGFIKVISGGRRRRVLGASIVGVGSAEIANLVAVALEAGMRMGDLSRTLLIYPTLTYGLGQLAGEAGLEVAGSSRWIQLLRRGRGPRR